MLRPGEAGWGNRCIGERGSVKVDCEDLAAMLGARLAGELTDAELVDWANLVIFNDAFDFDGEKLRNALDRIEESDEPDRELDTAEIEAMLKAARSM